MKYWKNKTEGG